MTNPVELMNRALHYMAVWSVRWTPEMEALKREIEQAVRELDDESLCRVPDAATLAELRSKAYRYDRLKALATAGNGNAPGYLRDGVVYPTFEAAFDATLTEEEEELSRAESPEQHG